MVQRLRTARALLALGAVATVTVPLSAALAQGPESASALLVLPTQGRTLHVGAEHRGELTSADPLWTDGSYVQAWVLQLPAGRTVWVDLVSDAFDAYLWVAGPGLGQGLKDDDGAGGCDSRITWTAAEAGAFHVVANTVGEGATGAYVLRVSDREPPMSDAGCDVADVAPETPDLMELPLDGRVLTVGGEADGELTPDDRLSTDGSYTEAWGLDLGAGQTVTVDLRSQAFDAFLWVVGPGLEPLTNDDGAGGCDSRITFTAVEAGMHRVVANTLNSGAQGAYTLSVSREPGPVTGESCGGSGEPATPGPDLATLPVGGQRLSPGGKVTGRLAEGATTGGDGAYLDVWGLELRAGQTVTVDLVSAAFDAFLWIAGLGLDGWLSDDDGAGACNSRITLTAPTDGIYRVIASSVAPGATGEYRLLVTAEPGPTSSEPCGG